MKPSSGARMWRSLAEYENDPEFTKYLHNEFGTPLTDTPPNSNERRRFMQLMAASFSLAGVAGCRWEQDHIVPMTRQPEGTIPGVPRFYNTAMELGGVGVPLRVKSYDGRPIKIDGNTEHPDTLGASGVYEQASLLEMYDPDRSRGPAQFQNGVATDTTWEEFRKFALKHFGALRQASGAGLFVLSESTSSATTADMKQRFLALYPQAQWFEYEPNNRDNERQGAKLAFGEVVRTHYDLAKAEVVLCLDADPLGTGPEALILGKGFAAARDPEAGKANRMWVAESSLSPTGIQADHRIVIRSSQVLALAAALEAALAPQLGQRATQTAPAAKFLADPKMVKLFGALVKDLVASRGKSAVLVGGSQSPEVHALGHRLNALLGNVGNTVRYTADEDKSFLRQGLAALVKKAAEIKTLVILGGNPVYTASGDVDFASVLKAGATSIHLSLYRDETSHLCSWHLPLAHYLESWGDCRSYNGSLLVQQPLIAPLFQAPTIPEFLALLSRDEIKGGPELVQRAFGARASDEKAWRRAVHDGGAAGTEGAVVTPTLAALSAFAIGEGALGDLSSSGPLEVTFAADPKVYDGRFANNGWLQELPEPAMKLTWDNAAFINPKTAAALGIEDCAVVTVAVDGRSITLPALMSPGQAQGSIRLVLGYGRTHAGVVAGAKSPVGADPVDPVGVSVYPLRSVANWDVALGAKVTSTGTKVKLATTQDKHPMDDIGVAGTQSRLPMLVRQDTFENFKKRPDHVKHAVHHPPLLSLWNDPVSYEGYKWGMTIDLNRCSGCAACVVACNAENNIPVVGKSQVLRGREMHWMRIDRYFQGENHDEPDQVHNQPVLCMHCEHAPCEQVCPVGATMHSSEGLNDMAYNRCIGTRYCSNNCPYKVRRFNYFNYTEPLTEPRNEVARMGQNPEVTVRFRGVMEKCSFCVQRIQAVKIVSKNAQRKIKDGEVRSACQDACPTEAIQFGDLNDPQSKVSHSANKQRGYALLEELNIRPRVTYLARITNPHPDLTPAAAAPHAEEGKQDHG
jgi:MoCo/4Fe-4S cofactor protein with predicted Tat translocation signal